MVITIHAHNKLLVNNLLNTQLTIFVDPHIKITDIFKETFCVDRS